MFNDVLNVRAGNEKRKKALAALAQKLAQNGQRAAGMMGAARAGGGLGQQNAARFRPLARNNMGALGRLAHGGRAEMGNAINRFGIVERLPGANDPGAIPDIGGISALGSIGGGDAAAAGVFGGDAGGIVPGSAEAFAGQLENSGLTPEQQQQYGQQFAANNAQYGDNGGIASGGFIMADHPVDMGAGGRTDGYVYWQGQMIPVGLYKALQASGELF